jgi:hypothetical protein
MAGDVTAGTRAFSAREPDRDRPASADSSTLSSSVLLKRRSGSFCRQRVTSASRAEGTSPRNRLSGSGSRSITAASTCAGVSRRKAARPVAIS